MLHKLYTNHNSYCGRGLLDYFNTDGLNNSSPVSINGWQSKISNRTFNSEGFAPSPTERVATGIDANGKVYIAMRKGIFASDLAWLKLLDNTLTTSHKVVPLNTYLTNDEFTIQMTCTYEQFTNWLAIMGICYAGYPNGLSLGQYDGGNIGWGFYPVTIGTAQNQHLRVTISANYPAITNNKVFNWAFTYSYRYNAWSGWTANILQLYINGGFVDTQNNSSPAKISFNTTDNKAIRGLSLGYNYWGGSRHFVGNIYSLLIYNKELSAEEIVHNYLIDKAKYLIP